MEQLLRDLQLELSITDTGESQSGSYLSYIKSRYLINEKKIITDIEGEWMIDFETSRLISCHEIGDSKVKCITEDVLSKAKLGQCSDGNEPIEVTLTSSSCGNIFDSPVPILFDNFVDNDDCDASVDFGEYIPSSANHCDPKFANAENLLGPKVILR